MSQQAAQVLLFETFKLLNVRIFLFFRRKSSAKEKK